MRHRSPRPVLDRLLRHPAPGVGRRGALVAAAVTGTAALGVTFAGPLIGQASPEGAVSVDSPMSATSASWLIATPPPAREARPSRSGERTTAPTPPPETESGPTPTPEPPSPSVADTRSRSSSPSATRTPSPAEEDGSTPADSSAPDTSAATAAVEDDSWTVESTADEAGSFECSLDGGEYAECDPTTTFEDLDNGKHTLDVRAVDESGNVDPSPIQLVTNITGDLVD